MKVNTKFSRNRVNLIYLGKGTLFFRIRIPFLLTPSFSSLPPMLSSHHSVSFATSNVWGCCSIKVEILPCFVRKRVD